MLLDYTGLDVFATGGERVGVIRRTYADEHGMLRFAEVELEDGAERRLLPIEGAVLTRRGLQVPYARQKIARSPRDAAPGPVLDEARLEQVRAHYSETLRDEEGVVEIPVFQEVLVKKIVLKEVLRIRKRWVSEPQLVQDELRHEEVEVLEEGDVRLHPSSAAA